MGESLVKIRSSRNILFLYGIVFLLGAVLPFSAYSGNEDSTVCSLIGQRARQTCLQEAQTTCLKTGKAECFDNCVSLYDHRVKETKNLTEATLSLYKNALVQCSQACYLMGKKDTNLRKYEEK